MKSMTDDPKGSARMTITADFLFRVDNSGLAEAEIETLINNKPGFSAKSVQVYDSSEIEKSGDPDFDNDCDFYVRAVFDSEYDIEESTKLLNEIHEFLDIISYE